MESFDFSNTSVSGLISIFSAVMGIAYPLIIQTIEKLDDKYSSPRMARLFKKEKAFKRYEMFIVLSILFAFASIYVMQIVDDNVLFSDVFITIHSLVTLALLYNMLKIFNLILAYNDPLSLIDRISDNLDENEDGRG